MVAHMCVICGLNAHSWSLICVLAVAYMRTHGRSVSVLKMITSTLMFDHACPFLAELCLQAESGA